MGEVLPCLHVSGMCAQLYNNLRIARDTQRDVANVAAHVLQQHAGNALVAAACLDRFCDHLELPSLFPLLL